MDEYYYIPKIKKRINCKKGAIKIILEVVLYLYRRHLNVDVRRTVSWGRGVLGATPLNRSCYCDRRLSSRRHLNINTIGGHNPVCRPEIGLLYSCWYSGKEEHSSKRLSLKFVKHDSETLEFLTSEMYKINVEDCVMELESWTYVECMSS